MFRDNITIYKYNRGKDFSCHIWVNEGALSFKEIKYPNGTKIEVLEKFLEDAEKSVTRQLNKKVGD